MTGLLCGVSIGLAGALMLRKHVRRAFGAGPAFTLWLLPLLLAALPWLPGLPPALRVATVPDLLPYLAPVATATLPEPPLRSGFTLLWLIGSSAMLLRLGMRYRRLRRECRMPPADVLLWLQAAAPKFDPRRVRLHASGPGVLCAARSLLLLPPGFARRFARDQQALVLHHELTHLRRGDPLWSLLAEITLALLWFHPLAWLAMPRLRLDQELACDEAVLRAMPQAQARYARTLLDTLGVRATPVFIPWLAEPQMKERLTSISRHRPGTTRRHLGFLVVTALLATSVWAAQSSVPMAEASADLEYNARIPPKYPVDAVRSQQQGTVILDVLVGVDGHPRHIAVHAADGVAPSLVKAASTTAMQWRFNPAMRDGKPIESHARVPVRFSLSIIDNATSTPKPAVPMEKPATASPVGAA